MGNVSRARRSKLAVHRGARRCSVYPTIKSGEGQSAHHEPHMPPTLTCPQRSHAPKTAPRLVGPEYDRAPRPTCSELIPHRAQAHRARRHAPLQPQARRSWLKKLAHVSNTRAERALGSVFYPMHFIPKMADHQGCAPFARATYHLPSREQQRPTGFGGTADLALKAQEHARYARLMPRAIPIGYAVPRDMEPMDATGAD